MAASLKVVVAYNEPIDADQPYAESSQDVLDQVEYVEGALKQLGHATTRLALAGQVPKEVHELRAAEPDVVFNLAESIHDDARLYPNVAALLELLGVPFTGSGSFALVATTDKRLTKLALRGAGLLTPDWTTYEESSGLSCDGLAPPWLVKPVFEDGSIGIDDATLHRSASELAAALPKLREEHRGQELLVEQYVDGRELNVSFLASGQELEALPVVEIDFSTYHKGRPRIYGYRAKWEHGSFEYENAKRVLHEGETSPLVEQLRDLGKQACELLGVRGYGRVDFRVSREGSPYILEVNTNPCLSDDASFTTAAEAGGLTRAEMVNRILDAALRGR